MKFQDVCGQEALINHMQSAIRLGKISHAYIISGEKGFDKLDDRAISYPWWKEEGLDRDIDTFWTFDLPRSAATS